MKQFYNLNIRWLLIALTLLSVSLSTLAQSIQVTNVATTPVCAGGLVTITFDVTNGAATNGNGQKFKTGTSYTVDLVLAGSPTQSLGTLTPTLPAGGYSTAVSGKTTGITGTVTIPVGTLTNSAYTISVTSTGPSATGTSSVFTVNAKPSAPTVTVVNNCNGTSTLTASNYTGSLLWSNGTTTAVNTINTAGTYTVTQTVNGCVSDNGSAIAAPKTSPSAPTANNVTITYDGSAHTATATAQPEASISYYTDPALGNLTAAPTKTDAGTYTVWAESSSNGCVSTSRTQVTLAIQKAASAIALTVGGPYTYDNTAKSVTSATVSGAGGLSTNAVVTYSQSGSPVASPINAGSYDVVASYAGDANHEPASNATGNLVIGKATASLTLTNLSYTYDGTAKSVTVSTTPAGLSGVSVSGDNQINAGTYPVTASLDNANYTATPATGNLVIGKADAVVMVTGYTGTYDGLAHGAMGTAKGVGGVDVGTLNLGSTFTNVPGGTANWTFDGGINYTSTSGSVTILINKANAVVSVAGYTGVYNGAAHGATGTATGAGGTNLSASLSLGNPFTNVPGGSANWTFTGGTNYEDQSGSVAISINKATASVTPNAKSKIYGAAEPALDGGLTGFVAGDGITASYTRALGETVSGSPYLITATLSPEAALANYTITYNTANFTITKKPVSVVADAKTKVYGTANPALTYTFSPALITPDAFTGSLSVGADTYSNVGAYDITQGSLDLGPNYTITYTPAKLTITPQTANPLADAFYTGATFFWTQGATSANATLTLSATLKNSPNYGGDIRTAKVSFFIRNGSSKTPIAGAQNLPVGLVNVDDLTVGAAATTVQYNIGNADVSTLNIGIDVSGNYTANPSAAFDKVITVAKPIPGGQIAGGADISANGSAGYIKGSSNVGFFVQYNKSLKNPQGGVDLKITSSLNRSGVADGSTHTYKIKSNAISVLSVGKPTNQDAQFTSKANIAEIIDGVEQSIEGNCTLQFDMTDVGPSGAGDKVGITVYRNGGGVWYSSNWDGTKTILKAIEANGQVSVSTAGARLAANEAELNLVLDAYPNPMRDALKISVSGLGEQPTAQVKLYNLLQRVAGEWTLDIQNGKGEKTIDLRTLEVGTYLLSVEGNQKRTVTRVLKVD